MRKEDLKLLHNIQKNAQMAMSAIDTVTEKVYDKNLSMEMSREYITFADFNNKALQKLSEEKENGFHKSQVQEVMLKSGIQMNTMLDTSTKHVADIMIRGNTRGITDVCMAMHDCENAKSEHLELAKELSSFEEKNIERLKRYL